MVLAARSWDFLSLPNCAPEVFVHARRHVFVVRIRDVFAYRLRVQEAVTANAAMPLLAGEDVWTPLGVLRIVFGMGHFQILQKELEPLLRATHVWNSFQVPNNYVFRHLTLAEQLYPNADVTPDEGRSGNGHL